MKTFRTIFFKEMLDTVRDRRTLFVMVIFPLLLFPLLLTAVTAIQTSQIRKAEDRVLRVGLVLHGNAAGLRTLLASRTGYASSRASTPTAPARSSSATAWTRQSWPATGSTGPSRRGERGS